MWKIFDYLQGLNSNREPEMSELAFQLKKNYILEDPFSLIPQLSEFKLFDNGFNKKIKYLIYSKDINSSNYLFDYTFDRSTGKSRKRYSQTVKFYDDKSLALPDFILEPEGFFTIVREWFGLKDIDFINDPEFSKNFLLQGEYDSIIREYFDQDVRNLCSSNNYFYMSGMNYYLCLYVHNQILRGKELVAFEKLSEMLFQLFKLKGMNDKVSISVQ